jgi:ABC-type nitrate/sulfonate/bicarbonate transport system permease component
VTPAEVRTSTDVSPRRTARTPFGWRALGTPLVLVGALVAWWLASLPTVGGRPLIAGPLATLAAFRLAGGTLGLDLLATFGRAAIGLLLGSVGGVVVGLLVSAVARRAPAVEVVLDVARSVPPVVWLPIFLLGLGYGDGARIATIAAGVAVIMAVAVTTAVHAPTSGRTELLRLSGAGWWRRLAWTQPWESLPALLVGLRVASAMAVVVATVTEMVAGAPRGVGARIVSAQVAGDTPQLTAAIVLVGLAGWALGRVLRAAERAAETLLS